jgi:hypothetical protein
MMDRRELLHRASMMLGGFITASAASGILAGCIAMPEPVAGAKSGFLTLEEMTTITAMADQILPKTETPGALDVGVPAFIDRMLAGYYTDKERGIIRAGLVAVSTDAAEFRGKSFAALTAEEQVTLMKAYDQEAYSSRATSPDPHYFRLIKELTLLGFCTSKVGATTLMRYEQTPGPFKGDVPVSAIGKVWAT